jgi:predicted enzyme related to lactoylglutathione lyase
MEKSRLTSMPNPVVRWQILSPEPEKLTQFYQRLFSWKVSSANALGYREIRTSVSPSIDGGVWPAPAQSGTFVQLFIEVEDVDASIAKAESLGATTLVPKSVLPDGDTMAVLQDPAGMSFGVCQLAAKVS